MKKRILCSFVCFSVFAFTFCTALSAVATANNSLRLQIYSVIKNRPYFSTQKSFVDAFIEKLDKISFSENSASWKAIDSQIAVDEKSFKSVDDVYYLVFKTMDNGLIGLVRFKCKKEGNAGFKKIEAYSYKKYTPMNTISPSRFDFIEETVCE